MVSKPTRFYGFVSLFAVLTFFSVCSAFSQAKPGVIKVGLGETVITPKGNVQMAGFARSQVSTGTHDDLHARCLVVEGANGAAAVLITITLVGLGEDYGKRIRTAIREKTGIPENNIVVSCTHTHAGPSVGAAGADYQKFLVEQVVASAVDAWTKRVPGRIGIASTEVFELGRERRHLLYGGIHPDPEVCVIRVEDDKGKLMGVAFNYGCHPSGLDWSNRLYSEDWPYFAIQGIKKSVGRDVWVAYFQSAEGNINVGYLAELSAVGAEMPVRSYWYIEKKGNQMTDAVLKALPGIKTVSSLEVKTALDTFDYPLRESYPITLEQAEKDAKAAGEKLADLEKKPEYQGSRTLDDARVEVFSTRQRLGAAKRFYGNQDRPKTRKLEQQAVRIGDAVFVTFPGELFSDIGLKIKKQSPIKKTFVIGLTCGPGGYLPSAKEFIDGDYEVDGSAYSPKTEQVCIDSSLNLIGRVEK
ncbi:MAG: neutral/alkaline non-lysosomal ceramidase N-terminal domain-containing protein [Candidatus Latescibacter sp.]|nr:neutral/alkaline non-lysosomal ceramidase N-terminal domain-containing protein [Candidatus Latescibacter sp.]